MDVCSLSVSARLDMIHHIYYDILYITMCMDVKGDTSPRLAALRKSVLILVRLHGHDIMGGQAEYCALP